MQCKPNKVTTLCTNCRYIFNCKARDIDVVDLAMVEGYKLVSSNDLGVICTNWKKRIRRKRSGGKTKQAK